MTSRRRRRRRDRPDENINLHIIKAAAIKAIEIMQIIRKRWCRGNFCRHFKIISTPLVDEYWTATHLPVVSSFSNRFLFLSLLPSPLLVSQWFQAQIRSSSTSHTRNKLDGRVTRDEQKGKDSGKRGRNKNYLLKITLSNRWKYSVHDRDFASFNFISKSILMYIAQSPGLQSGHN